MLDQNKIDKDSRRKLFEFSLLYLMGIIKDDSVQDTIKQFSAKDWDMLIAIARAHKVAPLLYNRLSDGDMGDIASDDTIQKLRRVYLQNSFLNTQRHHNLSEILKALNDNGIQIIILKGLAIAGLIYENIAVRPMGDIDFLVKEEDIIRIDEILSDLGWTNKSKQLFSTNVKRVTGDITYSKDSTFIDLHSRSHLMPMLDPWEEVCFVIIDGINIPILKLDDFFLHLCLHLNEHIHAGFSELIRLCDILEMLDKFSDKLNWEYIRQTAIKNNAEDALYRILNLLNSISEISVPFDISKMKTSGLSVSIYDVMHLPRQSGKLISNVILSNCFDSEILPTKYKFRRIIKIVCPSKDYMIARYTPKRPSLFYFYYPVRLLLGFLAFIRSFNAVKKQEKL